MVNTPACHAGDVSSILAGSAIYKSYIGLRVCNSVVRVPQERGVNGSSPFISRQEYIIYWKMTQW